MAAVDVVPVANDSNYVTFDDLRLGRSNQNVVGRLLRFWESTNERRNGESLGTVFLLLDEKNTVIHGFIPATTAFLFRNELREGLIYNIRTFQVGKCTKMHKLTDHPLVIRFLPTTTFDEVQGGPISIRREKFMIRKFDHLRALANTNLEMPDVVGQICFVEGSNLDDPNAKDRLLVRLRVEIDVVVYLSLWSAAAASLRAHLCRGGPIRSVLVVTTLSPKLFGGTLFLHSTPATRIFSNTWIHVIQQFTASLNIQPNEPLLMVDTNNGIQGPDMVTISSLYNTILHSTHEAWKKDFRCTARVVGVLENRGWTYKACGKCGRKLNNTAPITACMSCAIPNTPWISRYRVELGVEDTTSRATFVVFDSVMANVLRKSAAAMVHEEVHVDNVLVLPPCLASFADKHFVFHLRILPTASTPMRTMFHVTAMTEVDGDANNAEGEEVLSGHGGGGGGDGNEGGGCRKKRCTMMGENSGERARE